MTELCSLPPRLQAVSEWASPCRLLADVGTDHAHLPAYMILNGLCDAAYACDINEGPLLRARTCVEKYGLSDRIRLCRSDGLRDVPDDFDALVIAGMGGDLIARILSDVPPLVGRKILLQPMTKPEVLRRYLSHHSYHIGRERAVTEGERRYVIFDVSYREDCTPLSEAECHIPQSLHCNADALDYFEKLLNSHQRRLLGLTRAETEDRDAIAFEREITRRLTELWQSYSRRLHDESV